MKFGPDPRTDIVCRSCGKRTVGLRSGVPERPDFAYVLLPEGEGWRRWCRMPRSLPGWHIVRCIPLRAVMVCSAACAARLPNGAPVLEAT